MPTASTASAFPDGQGGLRLVEVKDVGEDALVVHDETLRQSEPGVRVVVPCGTGPHQRTPIGVFGSSVPDYGSLVDRQLLEVYTRQGIGDLSSLLRSGATWNYN